MARGHALLLEKVHATAEAELREHGIDVHRVDKGLSESELIDALQTMPPGPLFVGIRSKTHITKKVLDVSRLVAVGAFCIGTDQIDLEEARNRGVAVFNAPFSSTRSVAELVMAEVVMLSRRIVPRNAAAHDGQWDKSATGAHEVRGKTLGIVGYGHIGSQVSILAEAFGMQVLFHDIDKKLPLGNARASVGLDELLGVSDFVSLHVPDTELTRGMIGADEIAKMKGGSYLLNLSRGRVVDLEALRNALDSKHIAGAAIDVFPREPASNADAFESELLGADNVILTPHIGGSTQEAQANIGLEVANALIRFLAAGSTLGSVTLPQLDVPRPQTAQGTPVARIFNVHHNVPGVLSQVNRVVAESDVNIVGQSLSTLGEVGLLFIDIPVDADDAKASELRDAIAALQHSIRTRLITL
jgi:D-3-phosphoglycerate dehydrogenase